MKNFFTKPAIGALLIISASAVAQNQLFISEVTDPADDFTGRFIELYNAGEESVDFNTHTFYLSRQSNGGTSWGDLQLTGTVAAGATYVIGGSGFELLYGFAPDIVTGILIGNGDDTYALFAGGDHTGGSLHDLYGVINVDGTGEPWEYEDSRAVRAGGTTSPNTAWTASEWNIASANIADCDPGFHDPLLIVDTNPPVWMPQYPAAANIIDDHFSLSTQLDETSTVYYVVLEDNAVAPTIDEIIAGTGSAGAMAVLAGSFTAGTTPSAETVTGLTALTSYDIYVVAEDDETMPNVQTEAVLLGITTLEPDAKIITVGTNGVLPPAEPGILVEIPISVNELTVEDNTISFQFDLDFNQALVEYGGYSLTGTLADGGTLAVNSSVEGRVSVSYMNSTALSGAGELLRLQFNTLSSGTALFNLSNFRLNSSPVANITNGTLAIIDDTPPTAVVTYSDQVNRFADWLTITATFSDPMDEMNDVLLSLSGAATLSAEIMNRQSETVYTYNYYIPKSSGEVTVRLSNGTDLNGNEVVSAPVSGDIFSIIEFRPGDVDDDGMILAYDAALTLQHSVGLDPLPESDPLPWEPWRDSTANVDGTPGITANDAGLILQYSAGIISAFDGGMKKSLSTGDVEIAVEDDAIVFYSFGTLLGLNVSAEDDSQLLGTPEVLDANFISAFNITGENYYIGLCSAFSPSEGTAIMKIPYKGKGSVRFKMIVNTADKTVKANLSTGVTDAARVGVKVYPNPAGERVFVETGNTGIEGEYTVRIVNQLGVTILETAIEEGKGEIDLSEVNARGLHFIHISAPDKGVNERIKILLN